MQNWNRFFLICTFGAGLSIEPALAQSLPTAVETGLSQSPVVREAIEKARGAALEIDVVKASRRPQISAQASTGPAFRDRSIDGVATGSGDVLFSRSAGVTLEQLLFDWGVTKKLVQSAALRAEFAGYLKDEAIESQAMNICNVYVSLLKARQQKVHIDERLAYYQNAVSDANSLGDEGTVDAGVLSGRLATGRAQQIQLEGQIRSLESRFRVLTSLEPGDLSFPPVPSSLAAYRSVETSPRYQAALAAVSSSEANIAALRGENKPKLYLNASGGVGEDVSGIRGPDNSYSALAVVRWDVFDGGENRAKIERSGASLSADQAAVDSVRFLFDDTFAVAESTALAEGQRLAAIASAIDSEGGMRDTVKGMEELRSRDDEKVSLLTLVQAYVEVNRSELEGVDAQFSQALANYRALEASGRLTEFLGVTY